MLVDGWVTEAHHHIGMAVAEAGVGEGGVREREMWPGPKGIRAAARDFDPASSLPLF